MLKTGDKTQVKNEQPAKRLKAHPVLFRILCVIFAIWMSALLVMYFWTVYPLRHPGK